MLKRLSLICSTWLVFNVVCAQPGSLDLSFNPGTGLNGGIQSLELQPDGKILFAGSFSSYNGVTMNDIGRVMPDGVIDPSFNSGTGVNGGVNTLAIQPDGKVLIGGFFQDYNGVSRNGIARLNTDGSLDASFDPGQGVSTAGGFGDGLVYKIIVQSDGRILVGGSFTRFDGIECNGLVRLNANGSLDLAFALDSNADVVVLALSIQSDGKIVVGGGTTQENGIYSTGIRRLETNGEYDLSFAPGTGIGGGANSVNAIVILEDGKILVGGSFTVFDGAPRNKLARLNSDGSLDSTFDPGSGVAGGTVVTNISNELDGQVIICGDFTAYNGVSRVGLARLDSNGAIDLTFDPGAGASPVIASAALQSDGKLVIGGFFQTYDGVLRNSIARVNADALCSDYVLQLQSDATSPGAVTYEVLDETGTTTVISGNNPVAANAVGSVNLCLADGCYRLRVTDAAGDGLLGYILRESGTGGRRIIDNSRNMNTGVSAIASGGTFCVPIGNDALIHSSCDKLDWALPPNQSIYIVCAANPAVSAEWVMNAPNSQQDANSGYEFWFYDPNGSYSFRTFRSHNTSGGFGTAGPNRACHLRLNGWTNSPSSPHLPAHTLLNVRVRGRVEGVNFEFGPACRFEINPELAACPRVNLQDDPAFSTFSCGVSRNFGGPGSSANRITVDPVSATPAPPSNQVRYQFRFRIPGEGICIVRPPQSSATLTMNWTNGAPLVCGLTYDVDVRVSLNGGATWCFGPATVDQAAACADTQDWGIVCQVTINPCALPEGGGNSMAMQDGGLTLYPNPNGSDRLFLNLTELDPEVSTVNVEMYDLTGKRALVRSFAASDGILNASIELDGHLASGLYLVHVTAGTRNYTERLLIQP